MFQRTARRGSPDSFNLSHFLSETNLASHWEGVRLPRASGKSPDFPGSSPNFPGSFSATSPEVLSLWNLTAIQGLPGSFPDFPASSPNFPRGFPDFPGGQPLFLGRLTPSLDSQKLPMILHKRPTRHLRDEECRKTESPGTKQPQTGTKSGLPVSCSSNQRTAKGASGKGPCQKTSKSVTNFSTLFDIFVQGKKRQESTKLFIDTFQQSKCRAARIFWPLFFWKM